MSSSRAFDYIVPGSSASSSDDIFLASATPRLPFQVIACNTFDTNGIDVQASACCCMEGAFRMLGGVCQVTEDFVGDLVRIGLGEYGRVEQHSPEVILKLVERYKTMLQIAESCASRPEHFDQLIRILTCSFNANPMAILVKTLTTSVLVFYGSLDEDRPCVEIMVFDPIPPQFEGRSRPQVVQVPNVSQLVQYLCNRFPHAGDDLNAYLILPAPGITRAALRQSAVELQAATSKVASGVYSESADLEREVNRLKLQLANSLMERDQIQKENINLKAALQTALDEVQRENDQLRAALRDAVRDADQLRNRLRLQNVGSQNVESAYFVSNASSSSWPSISNDRAYADDMLRTDALAEEERRRSIERDAEMARKLQENDPVVDVDRDARFAADVQRRFGAVFMCPVHQEYTPHDEMLTMPGCHHPCCHDCAVQTFLVDLDSGRVPFKCPICRRTDVPQDMAANCLTVDQFERYLRLELDAAIAQMRDIARCPLVDCDGAGLVSTIDGTECVCNMCRKKFCVRCRCEYHSGSTCAQYQEWKRENDTADAAFERYAEEEALKQCPQCYAMVSRIEGCNHMTCRCGTHFCYICQARLDPDSPYGHFNGGSGSCTVR